mgnify:CR=1 FL=1
MSTAAAQGAVDGFGHKVFSSVRETVGDGRWWSDIFFIYQRSTANEQMDASVRMLEAGGHTFESLLPGWVQPTRSWSGRSHR